MNLSLQRVHDPHLRLIMRALARERGWMLAVFEDLSPADAGIVVHTPFGQATILTVLGYIDTLESRVHEAFRSSRFEEPEFPPEIRGLDIQAALGRLKGNLSLFLEDARGYRGASVTHYLSRPSGERVTLVEVLEWMLIRESALASGVHASRSCASSGACQGA